MKRYGLAVGAGRIGLGADVFQPEPSTQPLKRPGPIAGAVVCHDAPKADFQPAVVAQCLQQGPAGAAATLIRVQAGERQSGRIVDGDMHELPASAVGALRIWAICR